MKNNYIIKYKLLSNSNIIKEGTIKVKNKINKLDAKIKLKKYLEKSYDFDTMIIEKCEEDILSTFDNLFGSFSSNPFRL